MSDRRDALTWVCVAVLITCFSVIPLFFLETPNADLVKTTSSSASYRQLTTGNWNDSYPAYSPSGGKIVFVSDRSGSFSLYNMDSDGTHITSLSSSANLGNESDPEFDPSGRMIAFLSSSARNGSVNLLRIGADGKGLMQLSHQKGKIGSFQWSPDGRTIAYDLYNDGSWAIWLVSTSNGTENLLLSRETDAWNANYLFPSWGSNGTWIAFSSDRSNTGLYNIWTINLTSGMLDQLTVGTGNDTRPSVSPNGKYIAYVSHDMNRGHWTLWIVNCSGSGNREAVSNPQDQNPGISWVPEVSNESHPRWNPQSRGVMFFSRDLNPVSRINSNVFVYYMGVNVSLYKHIAPNRQAVGDSVVPVIFGSIDVYPSWRNDGTTIAYSELDNYGHYHIWMRSLGATTPKASYG